MPTEDEYECAEGAWDDLGAEGQLEVLMASSAGRSAFDAAKEAFVAEWLEERGATE